MTDAKQRPALKLEAVRNGDAVTVQVGTVVFLRDLSIAEATALRDALDAAIGGAS